MPKVLVRNKISGQVVEIEDYQLAHPHFAPQYEKVRVNDDGKVYALNPAKADADSKKADD